MLQFYTHVAFSPPGTQKAKKTQIVILVRAGIQSLPLPLTVSDVSTGLVL